MRILYNAIAFKLWGGEEHIEREREVTSIGSINSRTRERV